MNKFSVTYPDGTVKTFSSKNHIYTHMIVAFDEWGSKDEQGNINITRTRWIELRRSRSERTVKTALAEFARHNMNTWDKYDSTNTWRRITKMQIIPVTEVKAKPKKVAAKKVTAPKKAAQDSIMHTLANVGWFKQQGKWVTRVTMPRSAYVLTLYIDENSRRIHIMSHSTPSVNNIPERQRYMKVYGKALRLIQRGQIELAKRGGIDDWN